ncbi:spore germination protein GerW family protein [Nibribacter koreensis]|uniref:Sporulation protein YtfJ (Spore_YtfJ) n=1 Tax=Nibribacter koreensis TaxID=1084519 RepID=A0ABP8FQF7_9BACT
MEQEEATHTQDSRIGVSIINRLSDNVSIRNIFGEPIQGPGKIIIPVAQVVLGMGGGYGQGKKSLQATPEGGEGQGSGAGGGLLALPKGVFEVTAKRTKFIPVSSSRPYVVGASLGLLLGWWLGKRKRMNQR